MLGGTGLPGRGTVKSRRQAVASIFSHAVSRCISPGSRELYKRFSNAGISLGYPRKCRLVYSAAMVVLIIMFASVAAALCCAFLFWRQSSRRVGTPPQRATYEVLHTASQAVSVLRDGLTPEAAVKAAPTLRHLLRTPTVALADQASPLACHA